MGDKLKMTRTFKRHLIYSTIVLLVPIIIMISKNKNVVKDLLTKIKTLIAGLPSIIKSIYNFINDTILYNIVYYLARPASKSGIGVSTVSIVLIIFFISFIISYIRLSMGQTEFKSKILPHWTYNFLKKHRKTGDFIFIVLLLHVLYYYIKICNYFWWKRYSIKVTKTYRYRCWYCWIYTILLLDKQKI